MTENKARKTAIRTRMAETGEPYTEAARRLDEQTATTDTTASAFDTALQQFGISRDVLTVAVRHCAETDRYPLLGAGTADRLKISLDLKGGTPHPTQRKVHPRACPHETSNAKPPTRPAPYSPTASPPSKNSASPCTTTTPPKMPSPRRKPTPNNPPKRPARPSNPHAPPDGPPPNYTAPD